MIYKYIFPPHGQGITENGIMWNINNQETYSGLEIHVDMLLSLNIPVF